MKKNIIFFIIFSFAKGIVFLVPLFLADLLTKNDFGILEYALAGVGMLLNAIINFGVPGAYPYFILKKKNTEIKEGFSLHPLWLSFYFILNQIIYFTTDFYDIAIYMAINISFIVANQLFYSIQLKSNEKIRKAVFLDAGLYILLGLFVLSFFLDLMSLTIKNISLGIFIYGLLYIVVALVNFIKVKKDEIFSKYKKIVRFSFHLLISSVFLFLLTVSGRVLAKHFFGYEEAGIYGFYYRLAAIIVMIYQVASIRYFKELYTIDLKKLDNYFSLFFTFIFTFSLTVYLISPYIVPYFSQYYVDTIKENNILFFIIFSQMTMWIGTALNSSIIDREGLAKKSNMYFFALFILSIPTIFILKPIITLELMSFGIYSLFFITNMIQYFTLYRKKIIFKRSSLILICIYSISCIIMLLL